MAIEIHGLSKTFGDKAIFTDWSCVIPAGETTCVMGPSGCGKTTLLRLIMGLLQPEQGEILHVPQRLSAVFQEDRLCEPFSVLANIRLVCDRPLAEIETQLTRVGLAQEMRTPVQELSGGMKRRVAIVRALLAPWDLLLMDEPFRGLDSETRALTIDYVRQCVVGKTVLMVTHDADEVSAIGGRLLALPSHFN